jgi:hypothetical protein
MTTRMGIGLARRGWLAVSVWLGGMAAGAATSARADEALVGQPYGVAEIRCPLALPDAEWNQSQAWTIQDETGRVLYPVFVPGRFGELVGQVIGGPELPSSLTVLFLFRGEQPLNVTVHAGRTHQLQLRPESASPRAYRRLLQRWWREYHRVAGEAADDGSRGPVYDFTTALLARRLNLAPPLLGRTNRVAHSSDETWQTLQLLFGVADYRARLRMETLQADGDRQLPATMPLPSSPTWIEPAWGDVAPTDIESLAQHVPAECFYLRFGSFSNYLWFNRLLEENGGDLAAMVAPLAVERGSGLRAQQQLGLKQSVLADVLGPAMIADVAIIGSDLYIDEGPALGILFQTRNGLVGNDLRKQRREAMEALQSAGAQEETVSIAGRDVSFISTPDNRLRSFHAVDGDYHFVTTSRTLARRFLEAGGGQQSLGGSLEFAAARRRMPLSRNDTVFAYFSTPFLQQLVSPHYQVELARRLRAASDLELLWLARLAARGDGLESPQLGDLVAAGYLPASFVSRPEGGEVRIDDGRFLDSVRGGRGTFTPIPDMEIAGMTSAEADAYARRAAYYRTHWKQLDSLMVGVQRYAVDAAGHERLVVEAHIAPLDETKYGWLLSVLGPPTLDRIAPAAEDVIVMSAFVQGGLLDAAIPPHYLFMGIQDTAVDLRATGFLQLLQLMRSTPGYLGAWPKPGFLDWLPLGLGGGPPDADGFSQLPLGIWRRQWEAYSALALDRRLLDDVSRQLAVVPAAHPAQLRLYVADLTQTQLQGFVRDLAAERALSVSYSNPRLLHTLSEQLRIPRQEARTAAEQLLDGQLVCPLGGEYELLREAGRSDRWVSSAWSRVADDEPYASPVLTWFRGVNADLTRTDEGVILRAELDMQRAPAAAAVPLPLFDMFRGIRPNAAPPDAPADNGPRRQRF